MIRPDSPVSKHTLPLLFLEDYGDSDNEGPCQKAAEAILKLLSDKPCTVPVQILEWAAKTCIDANRTLETQSVEQQHNLLRIKHCLSTPSPQILKQEHLHIFQHLYSQFHKSDIDNSLTIFQKTLTMSGPPPENIDAPFADACKITRLAIRSFPCLKKETQEKMKFILSLLQNRPDEFFEDCKKLKIFNATADIFAEIPGSDSTSHPPDLCTEVRTIKLYQPDEEEKSHCTAEETTPLLSDPDDLQEPRGAQSISSSTFATLIGRARMEKMTERDVACKKTQYRTIHLFGKECLLDYGSQLVERSSAILSEIFRDPNKTDRVVDLLLLLTEPQLFSTFSTSPKLDLIRRMARKAMPELVRLLKKTLISTLEDENLGSDLVEMTMEYLTPLCFQPSTANPKFKKSLLFHIFKNIKEFLKDLNSCTAEANKVHKNAKLSLKEEEKLLIHLINKRITSRGMPVIVPTHANPAVVHQNLLLESESLLKALMGLDSNEQTEPSIAQQAGLFIIPLYMRSIIEQVLSPETLCILIDRLVESPINIKSADTPARSPTKDNKDNIKYTEELGALLHGLFHEIIQLSGTSDVLKAVVKLVDPVIKAQLFATAKELHHALDDLMASDFMSDTVIGPILILDQILYDRRGKDKEDPDRASSEPVSSSIQKPEPAPYDTPKRKPSITAYMNMSPPEFDKVRSRVDESIKKKPYGMIKYLIDTNLNFPTRAALSALPVEGFCQNLTNRLYRLSQQEMLLKVMFGYIKKGICDALKAGQSGSA